MALLDTRDGSDIHQICAFDYTLTTILIHLKKMWFLMSETAMHIHMQVDCPGFFKS